MLQALARLAFCAILAVPATVTAAGGLYYEQVSRRVHTDALGREREVVLKQRIYASASGMRSETEDSSVVSIVRLDKGMIYQFDRDRGVYSEEKIEDIKRRYEEYKALLRTRYRNWSDEKRRRMAALLGKGRSRVKAIRSSAITEIAGVPCRKVSFYENGYLRLELWLTARFETAADLTPILEVTGEFSSVLIAERKRHRGFPMRTRTYPLLEVNPAVDNTITKIEQREELGEDLFAVPGDFKKVPSVIQREEKEGEPTPEAAGDGPPPEPFEDDDADAPLPD